VILVPPGVRILLAARPIDFRKGMDGLAALVQQALRADRVKILVYDGSGLVLYSKRLEVSAVRRAFWLTKSRPRSNLSGANRAHLGDVGSREGRRTPPTALANR
jgi:hypothetical protein